MTINHIHFFCQIGIMTSFQLWTLLLWLFQARAEALLFFGKARRAAKTATRFQDLILSRRTINDFEPTLPDNWEEAVSKGVQAAMYAPNHKRTEPWRFHLLGPESVRKVCELNSKLVSEKKGAAAGEAKLKRWLAMPGWLVVTCKNSSTDSATMEDPMGMAREDYAACCCAMQNLCLSLHSNGLGTKWTTGDVNFDSRFAAAAGLSSEEYVVGTLWFGTPVFQPQAPKKQLTVEDVLLRHS